MEGCNTGTPVWGKGCQNTGVKREGVVKNPGGGKTEGERHICFSFFLL